MDQPSETGGGEIGRCCRSVAAVGFLVLALLGAEGLQTYAAAKSPTPGCQTFELDKGGDKVGLVSKLMGFGGAALVIGTVERKPQAIIASTLIAASAAIDLIVSAFSDGKVKACPSQGKDQLVITKAQPRPSPFSRLPDAPFSAEYTPLAELLKGREEHTINRSSIGGLPGIPGRSAAGSLAQQLGKPAYPLGGQSKGTSAASTALLLPHANWGGPPGHTLTVGRLDALLAALPRSTGALSGKVMDETTGEFVAGAVVKLTGPSNVSGLTRAVVTSADGSFAFENLSKGTFLMSVRRDGYSSSNRTIGIAENERVTGADVRLNNVSYPCNFSIINKTGYWLTTRYEDPGHPDFAPMLIPFGTAVISGLDRPRRISLIGRDGPFLSGRQPSVTWRPFRVGCGKDNSVSLVDRR